MSRLPPSSRGVYQEAPRNDIYTVLLLVALLALAFGTVMLALEQYTYYGKIGFWVVDQEKAGGSAALGGATTEIITAVASQVESALCWLRA